MRKMITEDKEKLLKSQIPESTVNNNFLKETEMVPLKKKFKDDMLESNKSLI